VPVSSASCRLATSGGIRYPGRHGREPSPTAGRIAWSTSYAPAVSRLPSGDRIATTLFRETQTFVVIRPSASPGHRVHRQQPGRDDHDDENDVTSRLAIMADVLLDSRAEFSQPEVRVAPAMLTAIMTWVAAASLIGWVNGEILGDKCVPDLYLESGAVACGQVGMWLAIGGLGWLATPLVWVLAGLFVGLAPRSLIRARRTAVRVMTGLPIAIIAILAFAFVLYRLSLI
jgi:hypothetical protein